MKQSRSNTKPLSLSLHSLVPELAKKNQPTRSSTHSHFKRSSSLPIYFLNRARIKDITHAYRSNTIDKLSRPNTRRKSPLLATENHRMPFAQRNQPTPTDKSKNRLTIHRGRENTAQAEPNGSWA